MMFLGAAQTPAFTLRVVRVEHDPQSVSGVAAKGRRISVFFGALSCFVPEKVSRTAIVVIATK